jgi:hypothetical protein
MRAHGMGAKWSWYAAARGDMFPYLMQVARDAGWEDKKNKAELITRGIQDYVWGVKRVFKKEALARKGKEIEDPNEMEEEQFQYDTFRIRGKDSTREAYRFPEEIKVIRRRVGQGRKLKDKCELKPLPMKESDISLEAKGSTISKWLYKKTEEWLRIIDVVATEETKDGCRLCGGTVRMIQEGVELCKKCNSSLIRVENGREWEGFLLVTACGEMMGGERWMRQHLLNKACWGRWRRAARQPRDGNWVEWWKRVIQATMPKDLIDVDVCMVCMRDEQQVYGLMREYVEQGCSAKRHGMHRRTLKGIFSKWKGRTGIEKRIDMEGSAWHWVRAGREGGSKWTGRPTNVGRPEWKEMVWVAKQAQVERCKVDGQRKRDEAKERELQKTKMREDKIRSSNSKRKPVMHSANYGNTDNRGGVFDQRWRDSKGCLVKTEKKVGRGMQWLESMPRVTTMIDVKLWRVDKAMIRKAVYGGMLKWMEDDTEVISTEDALSWHDDAGPARSTSALVRFHTR